MSCQKEAGDASRTRSAWNARFFGRQGGKVLCKYAFLQAVHCTACHPLKTVDSTLILIVCPYCQLEKGPKKVPVVENWTGTETVTLKSA
jgi:hypothetical protein